MCDRGATWVIHCVYNASKVRLELITAAFGANSIVLLWDHKIWLIVLKYGSLAARIRLVCLKLVKLSLRFRVLAK